MTNYDREETPNQKKESEFLSKEEILARQLKKTFVKVGDTVRLKKPKKNPIYGIITHIETDYTKVHWINNLVPANIFIQPENQSKAIIRTSVKKLLLVKVGETNG